MEKSPNQGDYKGASESYPLLEYTLKTKQTKPLSICIWFLKISISWNWFLNLIFELDFLSISNLIFAGYTGSKNQVGNRQKIELKNQVKKSLLWNRDFKKSSTDR